ncbi:MAG: helix-turn-helix transcriptional regulator [Pirellulales bacterium]|nr:helix-turn-helix transcriptional regulator [Pirellulales bacterium]
MNPKIRAQFEARAKIIKAMAHPTRLFLVDHLAQNGPRCVCELTEMVGDDMSTVSRHLSVLKQAGIVEDERHGTEIHYSLRMKCVLNFFNCVEAVLERDVRERMKLAGCGR